MSNNNSNFQQTGSAMPPQRLDSRPHRIQPRGFETFENTRRPRRSLTSTALMISTMVAAHGITFEVISPNGDMGRTNPGFENIVRAAIDIADTDDPRLSSGELLVHADLDEEKRVVAILRCQDGSMRYLSVKILTDYQYRIKAINETLESVDVESLDSENCGICIEPYTTAATLSEPDTVVTIPEEPSTFDVANGFEDSIDTSNNSEDSIIISHDPHHAAVKIKKCEHIFGRRCITQWLKENDTCPMCRCKLSLPIPCHLQVWVV
ncbi:hypothetical protein EAE96_007154 [Botrytis aclada]|nr:hypothetical protein EAE96_007154 [Botrytis aclada]